MKVLYIANNRIPTEKAHGIQIAKMCEAFERFSELKLIVPKRNNFIQKDIFDYYKLENNFEIKYLSAIDLVGTIPRFGFWLSSWSFAKKAKKYLSFKKYKGVVYSRDLFVLWLLKDNKNYDLVYEIHNFPKNLNYFHKKLFPYLKFVAISNGLKKELLNFGIKEERVLASHDGVDLKQFLHTIQTRQPDLILGNRSFKNRLMEKMYSLYTKRTLSISDPFCGFRAYRKEFFSKIGNKLETHYSIGTENAFCYLTTHSISMVEINLTTAKRQDESRFAGKIKGNLLELYSAINLFWYVHVSK